MKKDLRRRAIRDGCAWHSSVLPGGFSGVLFGLALLNAPAQVGSLDPSFQAPSLNGAISGSVVQANDKILIFGGFTSIAGTNIPYVARLHSDGSLDASYSPAPNGAVYAWALQDDGELLLAGNFTAVSGTNRARLARIHADGTLDDSFGGANFGANNSVYLMQVDAGGRIVIAGLFTTVNGVVRNKVARLNSNGSLDGSFDPGSGPNGDVTGGLVVQPDGKVIIGGTFTAVAGALRPYIARLNENGSVDETFECGTSLYGTLRAGLNPVQRMALLPDGKILVAGSFTACNGVSERSGVVQLTRDGLVDLAFGPTPSVNDAVYTAAVQDDGRVILGGQFTSVGGNSSLSRLARFRTDGSMDPSFALGSGVGGLAGSYVSGITVQRDGRILVAGSFTSYNGVPRTNLARIEGLSSAAGGEVQFASATYDTAENGSYSTIEVRRSGTVGNLVTVGYHTLNGTADGGDYLPTSGSVTFGPGESSKVFFVTNVTDFDVEDTETVLLFLDSNPTGDAVLGSQPTAVLRIRDDDRFPFLDPRNFNFGQGLSVSEIATQSDGRVLVAGAFSSLAGVNRRWLARFHPDGQVDESFNSHLYIADGVIGSDPYLPAISALVVQPDGGIVIGGTFTNVNGVARSRVARLDHDGTLDPSFDARNLFNNSVYALAVQADRRILVGGPFTAVGGGVRNRLARLYSDGSLDATYQASANDVVHRIDIQPDGYVLVAGSFTQVNGIFRPGLARLNPEGLLDTTFDPGRGCTGSIFSFSLQNDGKILVAGNFTAYNGVPRRNLARLNQDGTLDPSFSIGSGPDGPVNIVTVLRNGNIMAGGAFANFDTRTNLSCLIRLLPGGSVDPTFDSRIGVGSPSVAPGQVFALQEQAGDRVLVGGNFGTFSALSRKFLARLETAEPALGGEIEFSMTAYEANESNPGVAVELRRTGNLDRAASVQYYAGAATATLEDYSCDGLPGDPATLLFDAGESTQTLLLQIYADAEMEGPETFSLFLLNAGGGAALGGQRGALVTIADDDNRSAIDNWNPGFAIMTNGTITAMVLQPDGKLLTVGDFSEVGGANRYRIVRLNPDGTVDSSFKPAAFVDGGLIRAMALQSNGRIVLGGDFTMVNGVARDRLARLKPDGTWDSSFNTSASATVNTIAVQPNDLVLVGGAFTSIKGLPRLGIARLLADGTPDGKFGAVGGGVKGTVTCIALQPDGKVVVGGNFTEANGVAQKHIARFNDGAALDPGFNPGTSAEGIISAGASAGLYAIAVQPDGKVVVAGNFASFNGIARQGIARLHVNGLVDMDFRPGSGANNIVTSVALQSDGLVLLGGLFTQIDGVPLNRFARLRDDGSIDPSLDMGETIPGYAAGINGSSAQVNALLALPDGKFLLGGNFARVNGLPRNYLARVQSGIRPSLFEFAARTFVAREGAPDPVATISVLRRGTINSLARVSYLIANGTANPGDYRHPSGNTGTLTFQAGQTSNSFSIGIIDDSSLEQSFETVNLTLFNATGNAGLGSDRTAVLKILDNESAGSLDRVDFGVAGGQILAGTVLPDAGLLVTGDFTVAGGQNRRGMARFGPDGTLDPFFNPYLTVGGGLVRVVVPLTDGKILLGGDFTSVGGTNRARLARLDELGYVDAYFEVPSGGVNNSVHAIAVQSDGWILIAGDFTAVAGQPRARVARVYSDGWLDETFTFYPGPGPNNTVRALGLQTGGRIVIAGNFTTIDGSAKNYLARLTEYGALEPGFPAGIGPNGNVRALAVQDDGKILIGGEFTAVNGSNCVRLARLHPDGSLDLSFDVGAGPTNQFGASYVAQLALQSDGMILVGGEFSKFNNNTNHARLVRLRPDGQVDPSFSLGTGPSGTVNALFLDPFDRAYFGGTFTNINGLAYPYLGRLQGFALPPPQLEFVSITFAGSGPVTLTLQGQVDDQFTIDRCDNLTVANWIPVSTGTVPEPIFVVTDPNPPMATNAFYRGRSSR